MLQSKKYLSTSEEQTKLFGKKFAKNLRKQSTVCFFGDLGSGKTTFIKSVVSAVNNTEEKHVTSPTFTYLNIYPGTPNIYHFDLYRIKNEKHFLNMGFYEYFLKDGIRLIEWAEKIPSLIPPKATTVHMLNLKKPKNRQIVILNL
jgi:tRNA threonylcarbamoyladenosine biosynthesis protein TsaE